MCTELGLAILYFLSIFVVNFFLFKVLKNYFKNILYLQKIRTIFTTFSNKTDLKLISLLYLFSKKETKNRNLLNQMNLIKNLEDYLIIGNIYSNLLENEETSFSKRKSENFYFELLEKQYLSNVISLK
jgi:hypothetical protein